VASLPKSEMPPASGRASAHTWHFDATCRTMN
jgi:hypothetical protein